MKVLTVRQPFAELIASGWKQTENRPWSTTYRGELAIHAAKAYAKEHPAIPAAACDGPRGVIVAVVSLDGIHLSAPRCCDEPYAAPDARYHWEISGARHLIRPVPFVGALPLRDLPQLVERMVRAQLPLVTAVTPVTGQVAP